MALHNQCVEICCDKQKVQGSREICHSCIYNRVLCQIALLHRAALFVCGRECSREQIEGTVVDLDKNPISMDLTDILHSSCILSECSFNHVCMFVCLAERIKSIVWWPNHVSFPPLRYSYIFKEPISIIHLPLYY